MEAENNEQNIDRSLNKILKEILKLISQLLSESERAAVVLGAARLDLALERSLKKAMKHHPGGNDNLFGPDRPLGSLYAKISLAYRLGIIDSKFEHALQMIRKIRNDFAHSIADENLSSSRQSQRIQEYLDDVKQDELWNNYYAFIDKQNVSLELKEFATSLCVIIGTLEMLSVCLKEIEVSDTASFCEGGTNKPNS